MEKNHAVTALPTWFSAKLLVGMLRGIERESLRMQANGQLAQSPHPAGLGSALTHPHITTDYSEALLELITPPCESIDQSLGFLQQLHQVVAHSLDPNESLWPLSMPCMLDEDEQRIPLAQYGKSNLGQFKTLYRMGLGVRYGRRMQTIAGLHYNLSFSDQLFEAWRAAENPTQPLQQFRSDKYFGLIRNFLRLTPLVIYLLGASPSVCRCFLTGREHHLQPLIGGTYYLPEATALRMGHLGYHNSTQKQLKIEYNNIEDYVAGLKDALQTKYAEFSNIGIDAADGTPLQINDAILQIENEYYSLIRPKQVPRADETPSDALVNRGISYVELRAVDVNPYSPIGIDRCSAHFLEVLALYALISDSPEISDVERQQIEQNQVSVVNYGRQSDLILETANGQMTFNAWAETHLQQLKIFAKQLDYANDTEDGPYQQSIEEMAQRLADVNKTVSARMLAQTQELGGTWNFGYQLAQQHRQHFMQSELSAEQQTYFSAMAEQSIEDTLQLEQQQTIDFKTYLTNYRQL